VKSQSLIALLLAGQVSIGTPRASSIGAATAEGDFRINGVPVKARSALLEGSAIQTGDTSATLHFANGSRLELAPESGARVFGNRTILERGKSQFAVVGDYKIEVLNLRVAALSANAFGRVAIEGRHGVAINILSGLCRVTNASGAIVADMTPATALHFQDPEASAATPAMRMTGCLRKKDGRYVLKDETTNITAELKAADAKILEKEVKHHIEITGARLAAVAPVEGASQVIDVSELKRKSKRCALPAAIWWGAGSATAIISGVIVSRVAGGTVVAPPAVVEPPPQISPTNP
jgi:hypothetical protein